MTVKTLLRHLITGEFNSPVNSLWASYARVEPYAGLVCSLGAKEGSHLAPLSTCAYAASEAAEMQGVCLRGCKGGTPKKQHKLGGCGVELFAGGQKAVR
eukprot:1179298-Prorocentrum_minimum.AAC.9